MTAPAKTWWPGTVRGMLIAGEIGCVVGPIVATGLLYESLFAERRYLVPVIAAALSGTIVAVAVHRLHPWAQAAIATGVFLPLAAFVCCGATLRSGLPTGETLGVLCQGLLRGWALMLTAPRPLDPGNGALVLTPTVLTFVASTLATALVLRTSTVFGPVLPPLANLAATLPFTATQDGEHLGCAGGFLAGVVLLVAVRTRRLETAASLAPLGLTRLGMLTSGGVASAVIAAGLLGSLTAPFAPGTSRYHLRQIIHEQVVLDDQPSPLSMIKSQLLRRPPRTLFTVRLRGAASRDVDRISTAVLDTFDGVLWTSHDRYPILGPRLPDDQSSSRAAGRINAQIVIGDLASQYLPVVGWPIRTDAANVGFNATSGVLVTRPPPRPGFTYTVDARVSTRPSDAALAKAKVDTAGLDRYRRLPDGLPDVVRATADRIAAQARTPYAQAKAIERQLRTLPYDHEVAASGHAYHVVARLLSTERIGHLGYAEQHAAAFAVLARSLGIPTRIVVGYRLRRQPTTGNTWRVTSADAHAWPEIRLAGHGWVPFEPTDVTAKPSALPEAGPTTPPSPAAPRHLAPPAPASPAGPAPGPARTTPTPSRSASPSSTPPRSRQRGRGGQGGPGNRSTNATAPADLSHATVIAACAVLGIALPTGILGMIIAEKARRRRHRRTAGSSGRRVLGAWEEAVDRLYEHGIPVSQSHTATETACRAKDRFGPMAAAAEELAAAATQAAFYPVPPDPDQVAAAWVLTTRLRRDLRRGRGVARAARAQCDPRPLSARRRDRVHRVRVLDWLRER